ncbi:MAG: gliding motility-associated C-terminal domain-containing protein, partial [Flavobacteriales bacterium]|nr:gliding motility-associated C-terminal domain-containing protein [Flavobacteriales bacterium]
GAPDGSVAVAVFGGTSPYFYIWFDSNLDSIGTGVSLPNVPAGTYIAAVLDAEGCNDSNGNFVYNIGAPTPISQSGTDATCGNTSDGSVTISVTGGTPPYTYTWQEIDSGNQYSGQTVTGIPQGIYVVTISDSQVPSCATFSAIGVGGPELIEAYYAVTPESCLGSSDGIITPYVSGGISPYTYSWSNGATGPGVSGVSGGFYSVTITDAIGCQLVDTGTINVLSNLSLLGSVIQPSCGSSDGSISLSPSGGVGGYSFSWNGGLTGQLQSGLSPGTYSITVTDGAGCSDTISFTLLGAQPITFYAFGYSDTCSAGIGAIQIDSVLGGMDSYIYSLDNVNFQLSNVFTNLVADTFDVFVADSGSCISYSQVIVTDTTFNLVITFNSIPDTLCPGDEVIITANGGNEYNWLTEGSVSSSITLILDSTTSFPVEITTGNCSVIDTTVIYVQDTRSCWDLTVETPNAFSPDGDGTNDFWIIRGIEFTDNKVTIFNRWGDYIGEFENYDNSSVVWDGTNGNGEPLPTGTYFYVLEIDGEITERDWIQIVR